MANILQTLSIICIILGVAALIVAIVLFFCLDVRGIQRELNNQVDTKWLMRKRQGGKAKKAKEPEPTDQKNAALDEPPTLSSDGEIQRDSLSEVYQHGDWGQEATEGEWTEATLPHEDATEPLRKMAQYGGEEATEPAAQSRYANDEELTEPAAQSRYAHDEELTEPAAQSRYAHDEELTEPAAQSRYAYDEEATESADSRDYDADEEATERNTVPQARERNSNDFTVTKSILLTSTQERIR